MTNTDISTTYRLQLHTVGGLDGATDLVPYLRDLGVSTLYLSPVFVARSGSDHGYDLVDPGGADPALGGDEALARLGAACREAGLSLLLDLVPNHMAASHENPWWWSILEGGTASPFSNFFDVDWQEPGEPVQGKIVLPILGRRYHEVLEAGELQVSQGRKGFLLRYFDRILPLDVSSHDELSASEAGTDRGSDVGEVLEWLNRAGFEPDARRELDRLLVDQPYWLVHWQTAPEEVNYRRFFNIGHLVALRMEREEVFGKWHQYLRELLPSLPVAGLRIDHVDGLRDPEVYLARLRELIQESDPGSRRIRLLVEKILAPDEGLPQVWDADGTTGYDFLGAVSGLLLSADGLSVLREAYATFTGLELGFPEQARLSKRKVIELHFRRDLRRLVDRALSLARHHVEGRDLTRSEIEEALLEVTVHLRVYRTYRTGREPAGDERAESPLEVAVARGQTRRSDLPASAFRVLRRILRLDMGGAPAVELAQSWQQFTAAVMAKGVEDTAFYIHNVLLSLNEVGCEPDAFPGSVSGFHETMERRAAFPRTLNTTSTHDVKRSEDVRARLHVLSELADQWWTKVEQWHAWNSELRSQAGGRDVPDTNEEWLLYQTLLGVWPLVDVEESNLQKRLEEFVRKAAREAKVHTSWIRPRESYEKGLLNFTRRILDPKRDDPFLTDFLEFQKKVAFHGALNSLSQVLLKVASPGVPDLYQGNELWRFSLVDPDNRRPVDWNHHRTLLDQLRTTGWLQGGGVRGLPDETLGEMLSNWRDGRVKLLLTWRTLSFRRDRPELFLDGSYEPLDVVGSRREHVVAFARQWRHQVAVVVAPRLSTGLTSDERFPLGRHTWSDTAIRLPAGDRIANWTNVITGHAAYADGQNRMEIAHALGGFPVALLHGQP